MSAEVSTALTIGVDIGGSKVAAGVVDAGGVVLAARRRPTPYLDARRTEDVIVELVGELAGSHEVCAVGVGAAGWVGVDRGTVLFSPHLAWRNKPLRAALQHRIGRPVYVDNDANAAAWAEYRFGAGRGAAVLVCLTLGTGIGGGLVLGGAVFRGAFGLAGEWGHARVVPDGRPCPCGNRGCWEQYVSGRSLAAAARDLAAADPAAAAAVLGLAGGDPAALRGEDVTAAAAAGDPAAGVLLRTAGHWLGQGIADLAAALDPDVVVVGGGLSEVGEVLLGPARQRYAEVLTGRGYRPEASIRLAELGPAAGLVGAADLARAAWTAAGPGLPAA